MIDTNGGQDTYGGKDITADKTLIMKLMRFFMTLIFLVLEIIHYGCELTLAQLPIMAEMTNSTKVGKSQKKRQQRYKRRPFPTSEDNRIDH